MGSWRAEASSGLVRWRNLLLRAAHPAKHRRIEHALRLLDTREEGECSFVAQRGCGCQFETADQMACECQRCYGMDVPAAQSGPLNWTFIDSSPHTSLLLFTVSTIYYSNTLTERHKVSTTTPYSQLVSILWESQVRLLLASLKYDLNDQVTTVVFCLASHLERLVACLQTLVPVCDELRELRVPWPRL